MIDVINIKIYMGTVKNDFEFDKIWIESIIFFPINIHM